MLDRAKIGKKLQRLRLRRFGENIREFERQSGVSRGSIPGIEEGKHFPMLDVLDKWLGACKISYAHFFEEFENFAETQPPVGGYRSANKPFHDDLEFVLVRVPAVESATIRTLNLEYQSLRGSPEFTSTASTAAPVRGSPDSPREGEERKEGAGAGSPAHAQLRRKRKPA